MQSETVGAEVQAENSGNPRLHGGFSGAEPTRRLKMEKRRNLTATIWDINIQLSHRTYKGRIALRHFQQQLKKWKEQKVDLCSINRSATCGDLHNQLAAQKSRRTQEPIDYSGR